MKRGWENGLIGLFLETLDLEKCTHISPSSDWYAGFVLVTLFTRELGLGAVMASGQGGSCAVCLFVEQQRPTSSRAAVFPVQIGQPSPNCVNCVRGKGQTSAPAPTMNRTLAIRVPSSE